MKKLLLVMVAIVAFCFCSVAQIAICETSCQAANPEENEFTTTLIPTYPATGLTFTHGTPVDVCVTIKIPESISYNVVNVSVDSMELDNLANIPSGLSFCASDTIGLPNDLLTVRLFGTPAETGTYDMKIVAKVYSESAQPTLLNIVNRLLSQGYSTGVSITVDATGLESPIVDFSANKTNVVVNEEITFIDHSEFEPTAWLWNFGDGTTSTEQNPTHAYATVGTFSVSLTATNANGSDSKTIENYITVEQGIVCVSDDCFPVTDQPFSETAMPYYTSQTLTYDVNTPIDLCVTLNCPDTIPVSVLGSSAEATLTNIVISSLSNIPEGLEYCVSTTNLQPGEFATLHIYGTPTQSGEFNIKINGRLSGSASVLNQNVPLNNQILSLNSGIILTIVGDEGDDPIEEPSEIVCDTPCPVVTDQTFIETTIPYYTDQPLSYLVNADMDLCITAKCPETTNVRVDLYNNYGVDATVEVSSININSLTNLPEGLLYCVSQANVAAGEYFSIHFYGIPTEEDDFNINITGIIDGRITSPLNMNVPDRVLSFETGIILHISQNPNEVTANFVASATQITEGQTITFTNLSQNAGAYIWTFTGGNPITSTEENPSVTYSEAGIYTVSLRAAASTLQLLTHGVTETKENYIIVTAPSASDVSVDFEADQTTVQVGTTVHFTSNCSSNVSAYQWTFDGGTPASSTNANPDVVYDTPGVYDVKLKAGTSNILINLSGVTKTKSRYITVVADSVSPIDSNAVVANFVIPNATIDINDPITMQNESRNATAYFWSFEGATPSNSTDENPTIIYSRPGRYSITLFATNGINSDTKTVEVEVADVVTADFIAGTTTISVGERISFTNLSVNATSYYWSFEGAEPSTSLEENPEVTYLNAGVYNVTLFATNGNTSDMEAKRNYITVIDGVEVTMDKTDEVKVYPNPVSASLNILAEGMNKIEIVDMLGRVVFWQNVCSDSETIDVSGLAATSYVVRITTASGVVVRSIVVE